MNFCNKICCTNLYNRIIKVVIRGGLFLTIKTNEYNIADLMFEQKQKLPKLNKKLE